MTKVFDMITNQNRKDSYMTPDSENKELIKIQSLCFPAVNITLPHCLPRKSVTTRTKCYKTGFVTFLTLIKGIFPERQTNIIREILQQHLGCLFKKLSG